MSELLTLNVLTIAKPMRIIEWMLKTAERDKPRHIASKTLKPFSILFSISTGADNVRALHLWRLVDSYEVHNGAINRRISTSCLTSNTISGLKMVIVNAHKGRRRKHGPWFEALHVDLHSGFDRLRRLGVKNLVQNVATPCVEAS